MISSDLLPDHFGSAEVDGAPEKTIVILGVITAVFTAWGSLGAITSFASLAFIIVFGAMSVLAFRNRDHDEINPVPPAIGAIGTFVFAPILFWNLYHREPNTFWMVLVVAAIVIGVELLYFERDELPDEVVGIEEVIEEEFEGIEHDIENLEENLETIEDADTIDENSQEGE